MSDYFANFPTVRYKFGDEVDTVIFQKLNVYVDILDHVRNNGAFYNKIFIKQGERPDTLSYRLYGKTAHHWTFFYLNDSLRLNGWPLSSAELEDSIKQYYPRQTVTLQTALYDKLFVGTTVSGSLSGSVGKVVKRNLDIGQLTIDSPTPYIDGETLNYYNDNDPVVKSVTCYVASPEYLAVHHYEDAETGEWRDIDPIAQTIGTSVVVTNLEHMNNLNNKSKEIIVIKPSHVDRIVGEFKSSLKY